MLSSNDRDLKIYRNLLRLFPIDFRERWGKDMETLCRHRLDNAGEGLFARSWTRLAIVLDALAGAGRERLRQTGQALGTGGSGSSPLTNDVRHAIRALQATPGPALIAVATLALAVGASTMTFSVIDGILLKPLPYQDPERIVSVWPAANFNVALVGEVAKSSPALEKVAGVTSWTAVLAGEGPPSEILVGRVSPSYFEILGVPPKMGRTLRSEDDVPGQSDVVVLSHALWSSRFGSDPNIVGQQVRLTFRGYEQHTVVGVMPEEFQPYRNASAWTPLEFDRSVPVQDDSSWYVGHRIARIAPGATIAQASEQVRRVAERVAPLVPNQFDQEMVATAGVVPLKQDLVEDTRTALLVLFGAVGLVLLIACANVANLHLVRGESRWHDLSIRATLGADRASLVRLLLIEALILGGGGGLLGILLAIGLTDGVIALAPSNTPRIAQVQVDWTVLAFALVVTLSATLVSSLWPALRTSRSGQQVSGARSIAARGSSRAISQTLIAAEVALAVVVVLWSGLMVRSLDRMLSARTGFVAEGVVAFKPNPFGSGRESVEQFRQFYEELLLQMKSAPGVQDVGAIQVLTGTPDNWSFPTLPQGYETPASGALPNVNFRAVMPGYFETLKIPLLRGRTVEASDRDGAAPVVVVNQAFIDSFWPGEDGLGKALEVMVGVDGDPLQVVGVVGDIRQHALHMEPLPEIYVPFMMWPWDMDAWIVARTTLPDLLRSNVREIVDAVDPNVPISAVESLDAVLARSAGETRFFTTLLSAFGLLGLTLGAIGIYGVTAFTVTRRRAEFGVRLALGATPGDVVRSALRSGSAPVLAGGLGGAVLGLAGTRLLRSHLYEIEPTDPLTLAAVALFLGAVAYAALAVPSHRAGTVDPVEALRSE